MNHVQTLDKLNGRRWAQEGREIGNGSEKSSRKNGMELNPAGRLDFGHVAVRVRAFQMDNKPNERRNWYYGYFGKGWEAREERSEESHFRLGK